MLGSERILVVDDDVNNLSVISELLHMEGYLTEIAENGSAALDLIKGNREDLPVAIVLDWNMPRMTGIEFLKILKADSHFQQVPVVMQTSNSNWEHLESAIREGAFFFLVKPFDYRIFKTVVEAAVKEGLRSRNFLDQVGLEFEVRRFLRSGSLRLKSLADAEKAAAWLALQAPVEKRIPVRISIKELLINAIEHGNLEISYDEKTKLIETNSLLSEVEKRQQLPQYVSREVRIDFERQDGSLKIEIVDEGQGFDFTKYLRLRPERLTDLHGNGIAMARINLSQMDFVPPGNRVRVAFAIDPV